MRKWRRRSSSEGNPPRQFLHDQEESPSVEAERKKVLKNESRNFLCSGLRIMGLDKYYEKSAFWKPQKMIHAVQDIYLEVNNGELLALLGHNGAGLILICLNFKISF